jgi:aryl sulfotransferase
MNDAACRPERRHVYQNHHLDSTRWDYFERRSGDIVISTSYKAGTTWMQAIVANLLNPDGVPATLGDLSPWLDARFQGPLELVLNDLKAQRSRRFIKTHLPLDGLPYDENVQYVVVSRDARDVFMSLLNHWGSHPPTIYALMNGLPGRVGDPFPEYVDDVPARWREWTTKGWFAWESDGYPYWSHLNHLKTWWEFRHLPNIRLVNYADLLSDLEGQMRSLAAWLGIAVPESRWPLVVDACRFETMKRDAEKVMGDMSFSFRGGAKTFINKGTNGRWRDVFSSADLELYRAMMARTLPADAARWMEEGGSAG